MRIILSLLLLVCASLAQVNPAIQINSGPSFGLFGNHQEGLAAVHLDGRFLLFWSDQNGVATASSVGNDIYCAVSFDEGVTFAFTTRVDLGDAPNSGNSENLRAAVTDNGVVVVLWEDNRAGIGGPELAFANWSVDGGLTWQPVSQQLSFANDIDEPMIIAQGTSVYAIWEHELPAGGNEAIEFASFDALTLTWSSVVDVHTLFSGAAGADVDNPVISASASSINISFNDNRLGTEQCFVLTSFDGGATWLNTAVETGTADDSDDTYIRQSGDLVVMAWIEQPAFNASNRNSIHGAISNDGGLTWGPEIILTPEVEDARANLSLNVDVEWFDHIVDGDVVITTYACDIESALVNGPIGQLGTDVYVRTSTDRGVTFSAPLKLNTTNTANRPRIVKTGELVYIFYETNVNGSNGGAWAFSSDEGQTWSTVIIPNLINDVDSSDSDSVAQHRPVAVDPLSGRAVCVFNNNPTGSNEVQAASIRMPWLGTSAPAVAGAPFSFTVNNVPLSSTANFFLVGVSATGTTAFDIGSAPRQSPLLHLTLDSLTFFVLNEPIFTASFTGVVAGGSGIAAAPLFVPASLTGATLFFTAILPDAAGVIGSTDPLTLTF